MRVGSDVAIARHAFKPESFASLKSQNRVLGGCHPELVEGWREQRPLRTMVRPCSP